MMMRPQHYARTRKEEKICSVMTNSRADISRRNFSSWANEALQENFTINHDDVPITFAACLVVRDDNLILPEWLAYHYEVSPLRRLIVAVDPYSVTSPHYIFETYRNFTDLNITVWTDENYMHGASRRARRIYENLTKHEQLFPDEEKHRFFVQVKQPTFYQACARALKDETNSTWTLFLDTDEYIPPSFVDGHQGENGTNCQQDGNQTSSFDAMDFKHHYPETVASLLHHNEQHVKTFNYSNCPYLLRVQHGVTKADKRILPRQFHEEIFRMFKYPLHPGLDHAMNYGKSIANVQSIHINIMNSQHMVVPNQCYKLR